MGTSLLHFRALISHQWNVVRLFHRYLPSRLPEVRHIHNLCTVYAEEEM